MGILTRPQGDRFVISSDHSADRAATRQAPRRAATVYQVWTGTEWTMNLDEALRFTSLDDADEYVRANYTKVRV